MSTGIRLKSAIAALAFAILWTGCGGGGGGDDSPGNTSRAPNSLAGRAYNLNQNDSTSGAISFDSGSDYTFLRNDGSTETGGFTGSKSGEVWTVNLSGAGDPRTIVMTFNSNTAGEYVLRREGQDDRFGTFSFRSGSIPGDTTTGSSTTGSTTGNTTTGSTTTGSSTTGTTTTGGPGYNGFAPLSLAGRKMFGTRTYTSTGPVGQTHVYTFTASRYHDSDPPEESDGNYTYVPGNSTATLDLRYTSPSMFLGDRHQLNMTFTQKDRGTFQSVYTRGDGTTIIINGDFYFEPL